MRDTRPQFGAHKWHNQLIPEGKGNLVILEKTKKNKKAQNKKALFHYGSKKNSFLIMATCDDKEKKWCTQVGEKKNVTFTGPEDSLHPSEAHFAMSSAKIKSYDEGGN